MNNLLWVFLDQGPKYRCVRSQLLSSSISVTDTFARVLRICRETSTAGADLDKSAFITSGSRPFSHNSGRGRFLWLVF